MPFIIVNTVVPGRGPYMGRAVQMNIMIYYMPSYHLKLIKMRAKLANLNDCAVSFLSRAAVNLCWYDIVYSNYSLSILPLH